MLLLLLSVCMVDDALKTKYDSWYPRTGFPAEQSSFVLKRLYHLYKHERFSSTVCLILDSYILYNAHQELCKYMFIQFCWFTESIWPKCLETNAIVIISKQFYLRWVHHIPDTYFGQDNFVRPTSSHIWMFYVLLLICKKKII